jgi:hypothetical protein
MKIDAKLQKVHVHRAAIGWRWIDMVIVVVMV